MRSAVILDTIEVDRIETSATLANIQTTAMTRTPFCLSSGKSGGVDFSAALSNEREDLSGEVTLQGSNGVEFGMPFRDPTSNIVLGPLIGS